MTPELTTAAARIKKLLKQDALTIMGVEAVTHFKKSFSRDQQGFDNGQGIQRWKPLAEATVKAKTRKSGAIPPILVNMGHLRDSLDYNADFNAGQAVISSDMPYAQVHNEGGTAGRNASATIPKRQFMGPSKALDRNIIAKIERELNKILS